ncbi:PAS domain S-box protein [Caldithrix abyssi]
MEHFFLKQKTLGALQFELEELTVVAVNQRALQILNKRPEKVKGKKITTFLAGMDQIKERLHTRSREILWEGFLVNLRTPVFASVLQDGKWGVIVFVDSPAPDADNLQFLPYLRQIVGSIDYDYLALDLNGALLGMTRNLCRELGYETHQLLGKNILQTIVAEEQNDIWRLLLQNASSKISHLPMMQTRFVHRNGKRVDFILSARILYDGQKKPVGMAATCVNLAEISERIFQRKKTGMLEGIIARISSMFAQSPSYKLDDCINETLKIVGEYAGVDRSYVFLFRENLQIMDNTHEWCAPGIEPQIQNLQGLPSKLVPWWMKFLLRNEIIHIPQVSALPEEASSEKEILEEQDIQSLIVVPLTEGENLIGFIGFDSVRRAKFWAPEDINLLKIVSSVFVSSLIRKNAELSLADSERRYRTLFNIAPDLIFVLDDGGQVLSLNPAFKKITGHEIEEFLKTPFVELIVEEDRSVFKEQLEICLRGEAPPSHEFRIRGYDGEKVVDLILIPLQEKGKARVIFGIGRDVTERKILEESLRRAERLKSIGTLAGGIAHDFNNILEILLGNYTILKDALAPDSELYFSLELIRQAIERGKNLVHNLLTFASKKEPKYIVLDLNKEIMHVVELLQQTTPRAIYFDLHLSKESIWIRFDQVQIQQMILNLCLNAIDAIKAKKPQGTITIRTKVLSKEAMKSIPRLSDIPHVALLEIEDDGIGIDDQTQKFLFDPFFTTKKRGTGLGLSVVFGVVKSIKGHIQIKSVPGEGSCFSFYLPMTAPAEQPVKKTVQTEKKSPVRHGSQARILLVEDDTLLSKMLTYILNRYGYRVQQIYSGRQALTYFENHADEIDLAILDYDIPELNGWELAQKILQRRVDLKIILTSGFLDPEVRERIEEHDEIKLFEKPYEPEQLLEYLIDYLDQK